MRLLHTAVKTHARFDDANLVSHAGLIPAVRLAQNIGLEELAREHVREAAVLDSEGFGHTFTLKELVAAGRVHGGRGPGEPLPDWAAPADPLRFAKAAA